MVYLHSATGEGGLPLLGLLAERFDTIAPMFPGYGDSEGIEQIDDMDDAVFQLLDLWEQLGLEAPTVVGLSRTDFSVVSSIPFEVVKPLAQTMATTAKLGWDPYLHDPKLRKRLWRITAPTLVVRGDRDTLVPAAHAETYAAEVAGARLAVVPDAAHLLALEKPAELVALVEEFVAG